jgi:hypothetical protein
MLDGKGLKDWQWVYKAFPKWMIKEMDMFENQDQPKWEGSKRSEKDGKQILPARRYIVVRRIVDV